MTNISGRVLKCVQFSIALVVFCAALTSTRVTAQQVQPLGSNWSYTTDANGVVTFTQHNIPPNPDPLDPPARQFIITYKGAYITVAGSGDESYFGIPLCGGSGLMPAPPICVPTGSGVHFVAYVQRVDGGTLDLTTAPSLLLSALVKIGCTADLSQFNTVFAEFVEPLSGSVLKGIRSVSVFATDTAIWDIAFDPFAYIATIIIIDCTPVAPNNSGVGPGTTCQTSQTSKETDPVNPLSGQYYYSTTDLAIPARGIPFNVSRTHQTQQLINSNMPAVWQWNVAQWLDASASEKKVKLTYPDGRWAEFSSQDGTNYKPMSGFGDITDKLVQNADGSFDLTTIHKNKTHFRFFKRISTTTDETLYLISSQTDRNGNTMTWNYDSSFRLKSITDASGRSLSFSTQPITVDTSNLTKTGPALQLEIDAISDWTGRTWKYGGYKNFPGLGLAPGTFTTPESQVWKYAYSSTGRITSITDPRGNVTIVNTYDSTEVRVLHQTRANGDAWDYSYGTDSSGNPKTSITRSQNHVSQGTAVYLYNKTTGALIQHTCAGGTITNYTSDPATGRLLSSTDALGNTWKYTWDANGNLLTQTDPLNKTWQLAYDPSFNVITKVTSPIGQVWKGTLDSHGNVVSVQDPLTHTVSYGLGSFGEITSITNALGQTNQIGYNDNGDVVSVTDALNVTRTFTVDAVGRKTALIDPLGHTQSVTYDQVNRVQTARDAIGNTVSFNWDATSNLIEATDPLNRKTSFAYSSINQTTSLTNAIGGTTQFTYNGRNQLKQITNAKGVNAATYTDDLCDLITQETLVSDSTQFTYDDADRLESLTQPDSSTVAYTLDPLGRPTKIAYSDGISVSYTYDGAGRRTSMTDDIGTTSYNWDSANRLNSVTQYGKTIQYKYDDADRLISKIDAGGVETRLNYDKVGRLQSASRNGRTVHYFYDLAGRLTQKSLSNGTVCNYRFDDANRLVSLQWLHGSRPLFSNAYTYDAASNRKTSTEVVGKQTKAWSYDYDNLYRLHQVSLNGRVQTTYEYDPVGNRLSRTVSHLNNGHHYGDEREENGGTDDSDAVGDHHGNGHKRGSQQASATYAYNDKDQLVSANNTTYRWNANGQLESKADSSGTTRYVWDVRNHLKEMQFSSGRTEKFAYNGDGLQVQKTDQNGVVTSFVLDGAEVINEYQNSDLRASYFLAGGRQDISLSQGLPADSSSPHRWNMSDGLGSIVALTSDAGHVTDTFEYDEFGNQTKRTGHSYNPYRYIGGLGVRWESNAGLYYMRARWMDPTQGRFIGRDPDRGVNLYSYAANNPINLIDPFGLCPPTGSANTYVNNQIKTQWSQGHYLNASGMWVVEFFCGDLFNSLDAHFSGDPNTWYYDARSTLHYLSLAVFTAAAPGSAGAGGLAGRGPGSLNSLKFTPIENQAGGTVWVNNQVVTSNNFASLVESGSQTGWTVTILSGAHGNETGSALVAAEGFLNFDIATFGSKPGVYVLDVTSLTAEELATVLNAPSQVIGGFCFSEKYLLQLITGP